MKITFYFWFSGNTLETVLNSTRNTSQCFWKNYSSFICSVQDADGQKIMACSKWLNIKEPEGIYYNEKTLKTVTLFYLILKVQLRHLVMSDSLPPPWTAACQSSLSITNSQSLLKLISFKSVMPSNHLILWNPLLLLPSIFPSIRVFNESVLHIR